MPPKRKAASAAKPQSQDPPRTRPKRTQTQAKMPPQPPASRATGRKRARADEPAAPEVQKPTKRVKKASVPVPVPKGPLNTAPTSPLEVFMFGSGVSGELGLGPKVREVTRPRLNANFDPQEVGVVALAAGGMHGVVLTKGNRILTWGVNDEMALGRETAWEGGMRDVDAEEDSDDEDVDLNPYESTPGDVFMKGVPEGTRWVQVVAGDNATFALTEDGKVYGWGTFRDENGKHGFTHDLTNPSRPLIPKQPTPIQIPNLDNITHLSAGPNYVLALDTNGHVFSWGTNDKHQLGHRLLGTASPFIPSDVGLSNIVSIHAGSNHAFAINNRDHVYAWGANNFGQTSIKQGAGEGGAVVFPPRKVKSLSGRGLREIQGGMKHSVALTRDGEVLVWGCMDGYQMGLDMKMFEDENDARIIRDERGRPRILLEPTALPIPPCVSVAAGVDHSLAVTREGKAYSWGFNDSGRCGHGPEEDEICVATVIDNRAVREKKLVWAGAGGQYSMVAAVHGESGEKVNGVQ